MDKIVLTEEKETLLIPLYGKAKDYLNEKPILGDQKAAEIVGNIEYPFQSLEIPEKTNVMMCIRAKLIDDFVRGFLLAGSGSTALHLGCGLDSRYSRIANSDVDWYDVDFEEVTELRRHFYQETEHYHLIGSSVTEPEWLGRIPGGRKKNIVIAEGLFMYLKEEEIKLLVSRLKDHLGSFTLIFDAFSVLAAKKAQKHPSLKKTGAKIHWGIDDPGEPTKWGLEMRFVEEQYFTSGKDMKNLGAGTRTILRIANLFPAAQKAHRLLIYQIG